MKMTGVLFSAPGPSVKTGRQWGYGLVISTWLCLTPLDSPAQDPDPENRVNVVVEQIPAQQATADFRFRFLPAPQADDGAARATFTIVEGRPDPNGAPLDRLNNGTLPRRADQPRENFFFAAGTAGGRLLVDLGQPLPVQQINSYSWHPGDRGPQVYTLYAADGLAESFDPAPRDGVDPRSVGWERIADIDSRPATAEYGGQYAVGIFPRTLPWGTWQYLLFDIRGTREGEPFSQTFFSEIDVVTGDPLPDGEKLEERVLQIVTGEGRYRISLDTTAAPELTDWVRQELVPVVEEWYPKIVELLPSEGFRAPPLVSISFDPGYEGVAAASGNRIVCSPGWFQRNLQGEAKGAVVHELVHVVQQYGQARRENRRGSRPPGWLVEGIADYVRWFLYEPESGGARLTQRSLPRASYDASYRVSANFLDWLVNQHDPRIVEKLNAEIRQGNWRDEIWEELTGQSASELERQWKAARLKELEQN